MLTLSHSTTDPFRLHGIRHFTETQGLPEYEGAPPAAIVYGDIKSPSPQTIRVREGRMLSRPATLAWKGRDRYLGAARQAALADQSAVLSVTYSGDPQEEKTVNDLLKCLNGLKTA